MVVVRGHTGVAGAAILLGRPLKCSGNSSARVALQTISTRTFHGFTPTWKVLEFNGLSWTSRDSRSISFGQTRAFHRTGRTRPNPASSGSGSSTGNCGNAWALALCEGCRESLQRANHSQTYSIKLPYLPDHWGSMYTFQSHYSRVWDLCFFCGRPGHNGTKEKKTAQQRCYDLWWLRP